MSFVLAHSSTVTAPLLVTGATPSFWAAMTSHQTAIAAVMSVTPAAPIALTLSTAVTPIPRKLNLPLARITQDVHPLHDRVNRPEDNHEPRAACGHTRIHCCSESAGRRWRRSCSRHSDRGYPASLACQELGQVEEPAAHRHLRVC